MIEFRECELQFSPSKILPNVIFISFSRFLLARFHMDRLENKTTARGVRVALADMPAKLIDTYNDTILRIKGQCKEKEKLAMRTLGWISHTRRPLTAQELCHALAVEPGDDHLDETGLPDVELLVDICWGLVSLEAGSSTIRLAHYTVQEYFAANDELFTNVEVDISRTCLTYLLLAKGLEQTPSAPKNHPPWQFYAQLSNHLSCNPFLGYAAFNWSDHLRGKAESELVDLTLECIKDYRRTIIPFASRLSLTKGSRFGDMFFMILQNTPRSLYMCGPAKKSLRMALSILGLHVGMHTAKNIGIQNYICGTHAPPIQALVDSTTWELRALTELSYSVTRIHPLHLAAEAGLKNALHTLIKEAADTNMLDSQGETPLIYAARAGHIISVKLLLENGADSTICTKGGMSAFDIAKSRGHEEMAELLLAHMNSPTPDEPQGGPSARGDDASAAPTASSSATSESPSTKQPRTEESDAISSTLSAALSTISVTSSKGPSTSQPPTAGSDATLLAPPTTSPTPTPEGPPPKQSYTALVSPSMCQESDTSASGHKLDSDPLIQDLTRNHPTSIILVLFLMCSLFLLGV